MKSEETFGCSLFFGFSLSDRYRDRLSLAPAILKETFIQDNPDYLQQMDCEGRSYLGKYIEFPIEFSSLELIQNHIQSLLRRLVEDYSYEKESFILLAVKPVIAT